MPQRYENNRIKGKDIKKITSLSVKGKIKAPAV